MKKNKKNDIEEKLAVRQKQYWDSLERDEEKLLKKLAAEYERHSKYLEKEIAAFYQQYGTDNVLEYKSLFKQLSPSDKRMLFEEVNEFFEKYPEYKHLRMVKSKIYKLNRLEGLQESVYLNQLECGIIELKEFEKHFGKLGGVAIDDIAKARIDDTFLVDSINKNWLKEDNFSKNIWDNRTKLLNYLQNDIRDGFIRGDSYEKLIRQVKKRMNDTSKSNAERLIRTEGTFMSNEAQAREFEQHYEAYFFSARMDNKTSKICSGLNGQRFLFSERQAGVNFPPMHPWCRSGFEVVIESYIDEEEERK